MSGSKVQNSPGSGFEIIVQKKILLIVSSPLSVVKAEQLSNQLCAKRQLTTNDGPLTDLKSQIP